MALPFAFYWDREGQPSKVAQDPFDEKSNDTSIENNRPAEGRRVSYVSAFYEEDHVRVCIIPFMFSPLVGGTEVQAEKQARQLQEIGHEATVVTLRHDSHLETSNARWLTDIPRRRYLQPGGAAAHRETRTSTHQGCDVFHTVATSSRYDVIDVFQIGMAEVAALVGILARKPVLVSIPTIGPGKEQHKASLMADTLTLDDRVS